MATQYKYFGRYYHLVITKEGKKLVDIKTTLGQPACDIKFSTSFARGAGTFAREGEVSVQGLSFAVMTKITSLASLDRGRAMSKQVRLRLDAGYFSAAGWANILDGFVWTASISSLPEMWLTMKVSELVAYGGVTFPPMDAEGKKALPNSEEGFFKQTFPSVKKLMDALCEKFTVLEGVKITFADKTKSKLSEKTKIDQPPEKLSGKTLREMLGILSSEYCQQMTFVLQRAKGSPGNAARVIEGYAVSSDEEYETKDIIVNSENGLLGVTGIDVVGGQITTFMNNQEDTLSFLQLKSELNPHANGRYLITRKQHQGHYEGAEWYTQFTCTNRQPIGKSKAGG